jgi:hypothetical protein
MKSLLYIALSIVGFASGFLMISSGVNLYWQGAVAMLAGIVALVLAFRAEARRGSEANNLANDRRSPAGPYTAEHFPCPDPMPGRKRHWAGYSGSLDPAPENDEIAFAVVVPKGESSEEELRRIGQRLQEWRSKNNFVRKILGLELLLEGKFPETPAFLFWLPIPPCVENVATVYVALQADNEHTAQELNKVMDGLSLAMVVSPAYYSQINR